MAVVERIEENRLLTVTATLLLIILLAGQASLASAQDNSSIIVDSNYDILEISEPEFGNDNADIFSPVSLQPILHPVQKLVAYQTDYCLQLIHVEKRCYSYFIRSPPSPFLKTS